MSDQSINFHIALMNTASSDKGVKADATYRAINHSLDEMMKETRSNLFVLCQDKIIKKKHELICKILNIPLDSLKKHTKESAVASAGNTTQESRDKKKTEEEKMISMIKKQLNESAAVYAANPTVHSDQMSTENFDFIYPDMTELMTVDEKGELRPRKSNLLVSRMSIAILTPHVCKNMKLLLTSWHGPHNGLKDKEKLERLETMMDVLDNFKIKKKCTCVIIGGDFNLDITLFISSPKFSELKCEVWPLNHTMCENSDGKKLVDYVVGWPAETIKLKKSYIVCRDNRRPRPLDHRTFIFQFTLNIPPTAQESERICGEDANTPTEQRFEKQGHWSHSQVFKEQGKIGFDSSGKLFIKSNQSDSPTRVTRNPNFGSAPKSSGLTEYHHNIPDSHGYSRDSNFSPFPLTYLQQEQWPSSLSRRGSFLRHDDDQRQKAPQTAAHRGQQQPLPAVDHRQHQLQAAQPASHYQQQQQQPQLAVHHHQQQPQYDAHRLQQQQPQLAVHHHQQQPQYDAHRLQQQQPQLAVHYQQQQPQSAAHCQQQQQQPHQPAAQQQQQQLNHRATQHQPKCIIL